MMVLIASTTVLNMVFIPSHSPEKKSFIPFHTAFTISGKKMNNFTPGTLSIFQSELSCFNVHSE